MRKVLIISYYFPPSNFVGGERTNSWAEHFKKFGLYPIIITRNWNENQKTITERVLNNDIRHERYDSHEIYRLPVEYTLRDRIASIQWLTVVRRLLTFINSFFSNFWIKALPYSNFYDQAEKLIKEDSEIIALIASGRPFHSFFIGYKLQKKFNLIWIPDYRDEWTTNQVLKPKNILERILFRIEQRSEKKWTANAAFLSTVSEYWAERILFFLNNRIDGLIIRNGYNQIKIEKKQILENKRFSFAYIGTLYRNQRIELIIDAIAELQQSFPSVELKCDFIGIEIDPTQRNRIQKLIAKNREIFSIVPRMEKERLILLIQEYDLLIATDYVGLKGVMPAKLFEYFASGISTILYPTDHDVIENFLIETNSGYALSKREECIELLSNLIRKKVKGENIQLRRNLEEGRKYSREFQSELMAKAILEYYEHKKLNL